MTLPGLEFLLSMSSTWPLARWTAWHNEPPRTSQRTSIRNIGNEVTALFGGVRSGKTAAGFEIDLAHALGGDHPAVIAWMARNGIKWTIPDGPGRVWVVAATSNDSIRIHRPHFNEVIPDHLADWANLRGRGESRVFIDVPGYSQKAEIWFKSADQDVKSMKGDACRLIHFDEEPEYIKWEEASLRSGYNGRETLRMLLTMQPDGMTWVHREIVSKAEAPSIRCHWLDSLDNTALPDEVRAQLKRKFDALPENVRRARKEGHFVNLEGLVYPGFSRRTHVIEPFDIPEDWPRFLGCDWGLGNPTAILWAAVSPKDGQIVVYKEHYRAKWPITKHARIVNAEHPKPKRGWSDPRDLQSGAELAEQTGIRVRKVPVRSVALGIDIMTLTLAIDEATGKPGMVYFETCTHSIEEIEGYQWEEGKNEPKQVRDHTCDAGRYLAVGIQKHTRRGQAGAGGIDSGQTLRRRSPWR